MAKPAIDLPPQRCAAAVLVVVTGPARATAPELAQVI